MAKRKKPRGGSFDLVNGWAANWRDVGGGHILDLTLRCAYGDVTVKVFESHLAELTDDIAKARRRLELSNVVDFYEWRRRKPVLKPSPA